MSTDGWPQSDGRQSSQSQRLVQGEFLERRGIKVNPPEAFPESSTRFGHPFSNNPQKQPFRRQALSIGTTAITLSREQIEKTVPLQHCLRRRFFPRSRVCSKDDNYTKSKSLRLMSRFTSGRSGSLNDQQCLHCLLHPHCSLLPKPQGQV